MNTIKFKFTRSPTGNSMPQGYTPDGGPYYWRGDQSGQMQIIVAKFLGHEPLSYGEYCVMRDYFAHWIDCPIWDQYPFFQDRHDAKSSEARRQLALLRKTVGAGRTDESLRAWYRAACEAGIDPL